MAFWAGSRVTQTITSSVRLYWESRHSGLWEETPEFVAAPTGVARYPKEEVLRFPRPWVERQFNVTHWAVMPRGGHFAAMEQPALFAEDVRNFFRTVRGIGPQAGSG
jgi:epoxide hydrolase